jgi:hypothetical protein
VSDAVSDPQRRPTEPAPEGQLRVSDRERDDAIDLLAEAATDGRLTLDEYSERAERALTARIRDDLRVLVRDLASAGPAGRPSRAAPPSASPAPDPDAPVERVIAIFGSEQRRGRWPVPGRLASKAIFGECKIELQDANLHARVTVIDAQAVFGSIEILVPEGVEVQMTGISIFGSRDCRVGRDVPPGAPVVQVRGRVVFGEVTVRHPGWKEGLRGAVEKRVERPHP